MRLKIDIDLDELDPSALTMQLYDLLTTTADLVICDPMFFQGSPILDFQGNQVGSFYFERGPMDQFSEEQLQEIRRGDHGEKR